MAFESKVGKYEKWPYARFMLFFAKIVGFWPGIIIAQSKKQIIPFEFQIWLGILVIYEAIIWKVV